MRKNHKAMYGAVAIIGFLLLLLSFIVRSSDLLWVSFGVLGIDWLMYSDERAWEELGGWGAVD